VERNSWKETPISISGAEIEIEATRNVKPRSYCTKIDDKNSASDFGDKNLACDRQNRCTIAGFYPAAK